MGSFLHSFILFLEYIGMAFGPIFDILIVDYYLIANMQYDSRELDKACAKYWFLGIVAFLVFRQLPFLRIGLVRLIP